jgi:uncharacterized protein DUF4331
MRDREAMNLVKPLVLLAAALAGCGGHGSGSDGPVHDGSEAAPPPPALGAQIDRMGRPALSSSLIAVFAAEGAARTAQKDAYNQAPDPATWKTTMLSASTTIERELEVNLAVFDAIDTGMAVPQAGCGNALSYVRPPSATSYRDAADLLADDQLYVDTSKTACTVYLALEIEQASAGSSVHYACGGRTLQHDVIDVTYSVLAAGLAGLDQANNFAPKLHDGVAVHPDVKDTFPFLGTPR